MIKDFSYLEGIEFVHGKTDCYTMLQRVYDDFLDIKLSDYARPNDWWITGKDLYVDNFKKEGFFMLEDDQDIQLFDVFLIALPDNRAVNGEVPPNHCAIYIGNGRIIHHRLGKRSQIKNYNGALRHFTTHIIRHKDVKLSKEAPERIQLMDYILPHKRQKLQELLENE